MSAGHPRIRVYCDAESHAPKVATVGKLKAGGHHISVPDRVADGEFEWLVDEEPRPHREVFGTSTKGPSAWGETRGRRILECPLCGLRVELRNERIQPLAQGLVDAGVSSIRLSALAASL